MYQDTMELAGAAMEAKSIVAPTMKQRIDAAVKQAEDRLVAAKRARELLDKNPDLEELLNILNRNHF